VADRNRTTLTLTIERVSAHLSLCPRSNLSALIILVFVVACFLNLSLSAQVPAAPPPNSPEYLWYEAENMRGFATNPRGEPILNPSWMNLPKLKAPGWGINGPGVSAEWTQGGESEWNSAAASADETQAEIYQDIEIPVAGDYRFWVRYADWGAASENFVLEVMQNGSQADRHEFGSKPVVDPHDEVIMYWGWAFTWDRASAKLQKGPARISLRIEKRAGARRHVDCVLVTNDLQFVPAGRQKPDFAAMKYLRESLARGSQVSTLLSEATVTAPEGWQATKIANRDFLMPWNIARDFWSLYDKPLDERPLYPFHAEPIEEFVKSYKGVREVPIFSSKLVVPVIYINYLGEYLSEGSPFLRYLRETKSPFAVLINYGSVGVSPEQGQAAWRLLRGELRDQFLGWISGESVGYVWDSAATDLKITPAMNRNQLLEAHRTFYTNALNRKWSTIFHTETGPMWQELIPAQSTSSTSFAHALMSWGTDLIGIETAAVQPMTGMRIAFTRGAARQYGGKFLYYHAPNFGDSATTFTRVQNFAGPDNFFHSRYGVTMGPSLSWYRKSYYLYYMSGASAIYLEQGGDQFFKPGPGEHQFQLNPLGRITQEFIGFAEKHAADRGTPYIPVAFLLDPAHGWEMTDYPHWPLGISQINRSDRALRELLGAAYFPGMVVEGEPASGDRQAFVSGAFGNIFDVLVAEVGAKPTQALNKYRAVVVGGHIAWSPSWVQRLSEYVRVGGTLVLNTAQLKGVPEGFVGIRLTGVATETRSAVCVGPGEQHQDLSGQLFRYQRVDLKGATPFITTVSGDSLVTLNKVGKGLVIVSTLPDLLGLDERITPFAAHMLQHVFAEASPFRITGDVEYLINRNARGWVITLMNNNDVFKPQQGMATVDRSAAVRAVIQLRRGTVQAANEWTSDRELTVERRGDISVVSVELAPGGIAVVELVVGR